MVKRARILNGLKILFPIIFLILIYFQGKKELKEINPSELLIQLQSYSIGHILLMLLMGLAAVSTLLFYDFVLMKVLHLKISLIQLSKISWIANTFNSVLGFGGLAGASLRGVLFKRHSNVDSSQLMAAIVWMVPLTLSGLSVLAWLPALKIVPMGRILHEYQWLRFAVWGMAVYVPVYLFYLLFVKKRRADLQNMLLAVAVSVVEWLAAALTFWGIARIVGNDVPFGVMLAVFIAGAIAGVISLVPGGLGSFDLIVIFGMSKFGIANNDILVILLFYRVFYYFVPFILGLVFASTEAVSHTRLILVNHKYGRQFRAMKALPEYLISNLSYWALAMLVFISGVLLLLSASTPGVLERIQFAERLFSLPLMNLSHQLSVMAGFSLLLLSRNIYLKVKDAYKLTYFVLLAGAFFTFSKGFDFEEAIFLLIITALLRMSKKQFYRDHAPLSLSAFLAMSVLTAGSLITYVSIGYFDHPFEKLRIPSQLKNLLVKEPVELAITAVIGLILALLFNFIGFKVLEKKRHTNVQADEQALERFLERNKGNVLTHLAFLQDKEFFWSKDQQVFIMYAVISDKLVVLGDPIGNQQSFQKAVDEFHAFADERGLTPVFYQVEKEMLPFYHENGYQFFKLGEEAYVELEEFSLAGKKKASLRAVKNKFEREGYTFSLHQPPFDEAFLERLGEVSKEWLGSRKEKGFSLGFFNTTYTQRAPVAVLEGPDGSLAAFATIMPVYDENETLSVDLMRHRADTPNGTMDMLFISLMEYAKSKGYKWFNLGMAPLSNVGQNSYAFLDERIAAKIYHYGHYFYAFEGVRKYKEKFVTKWEPKYLAFRKRTSLPMTMLQISLLVDRRRKKGRGV